MIDEEIEARLQAQEERRRYDRSRLIIDVFFNGKDATGVASTTDIGVGGLFMTTQMEIPEGSVLLVRIPLGENDQLVVNAEVVYSEAGRGVGLRFQGLKAEDRILLERALSNR